MENEFERDTRDDRQKAAAFREAVLEGYQDIIDGRVVEFDGNLHEILARYRERHSKEDEDA